MPGEGVCCDKTLVATSRFFGNGHADDSGLHKWVKISAQGVVAGFNVQMVNDFSS